MIRKKSAFLQFLIFCQSTFCTRIFSVTRFGEKMPLWSNFKSPWAIFRVYLVPIWQNFKPTLTMFYDIGLIFILVPKWLNIEQNNLAIWSH